MSDFKLAIAAPLAPVSWGEIVDKISILEIKAEKIKKSDALENIQRELTALRNVMQQLTLAQHTAIAAATRELKAVNQSLWDVEDALRDHEREQNFSTSFIELARSVYRLNDKRAALKKSINIALHSSIVEEKSYHAF